MRTPTRPRALLFCTLFALGGLSLSVATGCAEQKGTRKKDDDKKDEAKKDAPKQDEVSQGEAKKGN
ncbi:hypothetical protein [Plesiocystis pacifica]|nr:hypothetical protein [Plesiocystis pacifica]